MGARASPLFRAPRDLELDLFLAVAALMLDIVGGADRHRYPFPRDRNFETPPALQGIGEAPELRDEVRKLLVFLDIPVGLRHPQPPHPGCHELAPIGFAVLARGSAR